MAADIPVVRAAVERTFRRKDVLEACERRDLGMAIAALRAEGITQGQLSSMTGIPEGRLSEYKTHKRKPTAASTFKAFADGVGIPPAARRALGLDPEDADLRSEDRPRSESSGDLRPVLNTISRASAIPVLSALRGIHRGYLEADRLMGSMCLTGPILMQMPVLERVCDVARGADRAEVIQFACRFTEFGGWLFQDAGDLPCAMHWTGRALDYALELGDRRLIAYTLMRKAMIATESGNPAMGLGIANAALVDPEALTPRLRAVILRQRSYSHAALGEVIASARDSEEAITEAIAGESQVETDRAPYCTPEYAAMEAAASWALLRHSRTALPILEKSRLEWADRSQVRDYAVCVARLAAAYADVGELEQACATAEEVMVLAQGLGSRRVAGQIALIHRRLSKWRQDPAVAGLLGRLKVLVDSFNPKLEAG